MSQLQRVGEDLPGSFRESSTLPVTSQDLGVLPTEKGYEEDPLSVENLIGQILFYHSLRKILVSLQQKRDTREIHFLWKI